MPELPEVEAVVREIAPAMVGARFSEVLLRRRNLRGPFPRRFRERLIGQRVESLARRAKYLVATLSSGEVLLMHLGMSGSFGVGTSGGDHHHLEAETYDPHDHVVFRMSSGAIVTFNDPRRFGSMDLMPASGGRRSPLSLLGPEPLSDAFDGAALARASRGRRTPLKTLLLDQRVVAGLGNIYASEALHLARLSPRRRASTITTPGGEPKPAAYRLAAAIKTVLTRAIARSSSGRRYRSARFRAYDREGEACPTPGCNGAIHRITQAGRSTFYCPVCQR
jgi:formamidopyrimidine-DNA glycosylase